MVNVLVFISFVVLPAISAVVVFDANEINYATKGKRELFDLDPAKVSETEKQLETAGDVDALDADVNNLATEAIPIENIEILGTLLLDTDVSTSENGLYEESHGLGQSDSDAESCDGLIIAMFGVLLCIIIMVACVIVEIYKCKNSDKHIPKGALISLDDAYGPSPNLKTIKDIKKNEDAEIKSNIRTGTPRLIKITVVKL